MYGGAYKKPRHKKGVSVLVSLTKQLYRRVTSPPAPRRNIPETDAGLGTVHEDSCLTNQGVHRQPGRPYHVQNAREADAGLLAQLPWQRCLFHLTVPA